MITYTPEIGTVKSPVDALYPPLPKLWSRAKFVSVPPAFAAANNAPNEVVGVEGTEKPVPQTEYWTLAVPAMEKADEARLYAALTAVKLAAILDDTVDVESDMHVPANDAAVSADVTVNPAGALTHEMMAFAIAFFTAVLEAATIPDVAVMELDMQPPAKLVAVSTPLTVSAPTPIEDAL